MNGSGSPQRSLAGVLLVFAATACGLAQAPTPNTIVGPPARGYLSVEGETSWYRAESFIEADGTKQHFPGDLDFLLAVLRVLYSPIPNFAFGLDLPYRWAGYRDPGLEASFAAHGLPGIGGFVDWSPGGPVASVRPAIRVEYFRARSEGDRVVNVSDGVSRLATTIELRSGSGAGVPGWLWAGSIHGEYGASPFVDRAFFEWRAQIEGGPRLARLSDGGLYVLGLVGYRGSSAARQEGNLFQDRQSQDVFAGVLFDWSIHPPPNPPERRLRLSVVRNVWARNALAGWRSTLSFRTGL